MAVLYVAVWWKVRHTLGWSFRGGDDLGWVADVEHRNTLRTFFDPFLVTKNEGPSTYYIPLQSVLYWAYLTAFGDRAAAALRWSLLAAHCFNGALVVLLGRRLLEVRSWRGEAAVGLGVALFLLHPTTLKTVSWIGAGVSHTFALPLLLGAVLAWWRWWREGGGRWLAASVALGVCAGLLKETAATLPALLGMLALIGRPIRWRRMAAGLAPFVAITGFIALMQQVKAPQGHLHRAWGGVSIGERVPLRVADFVAYWLWPHAREDGARLLLASAGVGLAVTAVVAVRRHPRLLGLVAAFAILLLPFSIANFREVFGLGRYLYLGSVPGGLAVGWLLANVGLPSRQSIIAVVCGLLAGAAFSIPFGDYVRTPTDREWGPLATHMRREVPEGGVLAFDPDWLGNAISRRGALGAREVRSVADLASLTDDRAVVLYTRRPRLPDAVAARPFVQERALGIGGRLVVASAEPFGWGDQASLRSVVGAESGMLLAGGKRRPGLRVGLAPKQTRTWTLPGMHMADRVEIRAASLKGRGGKSVVRCAVFLGERRLARVKIRRPGPLKKSQGETPDLAGRTEDLLLRCTNSGKTRRAAQVQVKTLWD